MARSERGVPMGEKDEKSALDEQTRTREEGIVLYDAPLSKPEPQARPYWQAESQEISPTTEFLTYLRNFGMKPKRLKSRDRPCDRDDAEQESRIASQKTRQPEARLPGTVTGGGKLTEEDIPRLREQWREEFKDILQGTKEELPPLRAINHEINLIDPDKKYVNRMPHCPVAMRPQFMEKLNRYVNAGWWQEHTASQAAPLMCIPKKNGKLRTVVDARQRNDNTVKDVTPLPDQDVIREDVARAKYRSKIDLADAYEQVRVEPKDVWKTAFSTILGTYVSLVVQQGDCNAPATFQRLVNHILRDVIGRTHHAFLDDMFMYTDTIEEHERALRVVFERLRENKLYLKWEKCDLYAEQMDCLGHVIDDNGIHPDTDKLRRIRDWRTPRNYNDVQRFVGLINYVASFLPDISAYVAPMQSMVKNGTPFFWRPLHDRCFEMIKRVCYKTPILKPVDYKSGLPIWVICDASKTGVGAMYGQGPSWDLCRPAGFMSKKFSNAQQHYAVHELETLAILEALQKWEDKLVGVAFHVITDHKALEFFKAQVQLSSRQRRWLDYLSRFDFDITYVKGEFNKVADCLSRYFESDTHADEHEPYDYVQADSRIDPDGEDLPRARATEVKERQCNVQTLHAMATRHGRQVREAQEARVEEAEEMNVVLPPPAQEGARAPGDQGPRLGDILGLPASGRNWRIDGDDPHDDRSLLQTIKDNYDNDPLTSIVLANPQAHDKLFRVEDGVIWTNNQQGERVLCVPRENRLITQLLTKAHELVGHYGEQRTGEYLRHWYWWAQMAKSVRDFCKTCEVCQQTKTLNAKPMGRLHSLPIPRRPWDSIGMDFVGPFPTSKGYDYLWVVICRLISMVHLIPVTTKITASELSWKYLREVVRLHGLPSSIVSDRDSKFTSRWWKELHRVLGAKLLMSTSFHPQTDGQTERAIRNVGQILRTIVRNDQKDWVDKIDMVEFAINSSVSETTGYAPFELHGGYMPAMIKEIKKNEVFAQGVKTFATNALANVADAHDAIIEARVFQTNAANKKRRDEPLIVKGDLVYLSTKNLNLPKGRARKLCPKYIGPYKVAKAQPETSNYTLELPTALQSRGIHPTYHVSLLRPHHASSDTQFPGRIHPEPYDFGPADDQEWFVDEIIGHRWTGPKKIEYQVRWSLGDTTWEPHNACKDLEALDRYLQLHGVISHLRLSRK